jgi:hypothetical protein
MFFAISGSIFSSTIRITIPCSERSHVPVFQLIPPPKSETQQGDFLNHVHLNQTDWYFIAEQATPAPHLAHPEGCAAPSIVRITVPRVSRSCIRLHFLANHQDHDPLLKRQPFTGVPRT